MVLLSRETIRNFWNHDLVKQCSNFVSLCAAFICMTLLIISLLALTFQSNSIEVHIVLVETDKSPVAVNDDRFLSIGLDSSVIAEGFRNFHMNNPLLINYMKLLGPGYLRVGGTMADRLWFVPYNHTCRFKTMVKEIDGGECSYEDKMCNDFIRSNFSMSGEEWLSLNRLAEKTDFIILFDLNCLLRHDNGSWDKRNAETLIKFSNNHMLNVIWQLGNEPNSFKHVFNYEVNATQLAKDFQELRNILNKYPRYRKSLLIGPDVTRPRPENTQSIKYLKEFLSNGGDIVDSISWHQYYFNGRTATLYDFVDPDVFNLLDEQIIVVKDIVNSLKLSYKDIWLTETASAYGGGAPGYSNRYIGIFIWLDKLGLAAKHSIKVVVRQSIFKGYYALISDEYIPTPDWWISILYNQIVAPEVVPCKILTPHRVRLYCHCTKKNYMNINSTTITVFGMNLQSIDAKIRIEGITSITENSFVFTYIFSPYYSLHSKYIRLNGEMLLVYKKGLIPHLKPVLVNANPYLIIPPFSVAFWVIPTDKVKACV